MSEKRLRDLAMGIREDYEGPYRDEIDKILSEPPDLVVLLQWLTEWRDSYADKLTGHCYAPPDMAWVTIEAAINKIEKTVRLTDDSWEWVEEDDNS